MSDQLITPSLRLTWIRAPWDEVVCKFPVIQIDDIKIMGDHAAADMQLFAQQRDAAGARLVSCRLPHDRMAESMLLEDCGFRFIEMVYAPELDLRGLDFAAHADSLAIGRAAPNAQGQGYGRRAWSSMLRQAKRCGSERVRTSVVARNNRALNLYARLGFSFSQPKMTFHWVRLGVPC